MKRAPRPPSPTSARRLHRAGRYAAWAAVCLLVLVTAVYVAARVYLPTVVARKADVETWLTDTLRQPVRLGRIEPDWDGLNPGVRVWGVTVFGPDGRRPSVRVGEVQVSIAPLPLLWGSLQIQRLAIIRPDLALERDTDGRIQIVGLESSSEARPGAGLDWLLRQPRLVVRGGELRWRDAREPARALTLSQIDLALRNSGDRHRLTASAKFPDALCRVCSLSADVTGVPAVSPWEGELALRLQGFDVEALPLILRERLPSETRGRFDAELWSDWRQGRPRLVRGTVAASEVNFLVGEQPRPLALRQLAGDVSWSMTDAGWRLDLTRLALALTGPPWSAGRLRLERSDAQSRLELEHLELGDVTGFMTQHQAQHPLLGRWSEFRPTGVVNHLKVQMRGPLAAPTEYAVEADVVGLSTAAHKTLPSAAGVSGRLSFDSLAGQLDLDARNLALRLPRVFREPLEARRASGSVQWRKSEDAWHIEGAGLKVDSPDGNAGGKLSLELPHDRARSPVLQLRVDFRDGNGAHAARYYPAHRLSPRVLAWMESAFVGGRVTSGYLVYEGPTREFPFEDNQGRFELRAQVQNGVYRYLPGWMPLTHVEAEVAIDGAQARITGRGQIGALRAHDVRVDVAREPGAPHRSVRVQGKLDGPVAETARVLQAIESKTAEAWRARLPEIVHAAGTGALELDVRVPLKSDVGRSFLAVYRFENALLKLANGTGLEKANGIVRFSEAGLRDSSARAQLFGGPVTLVAASNNGEMRLQANGKVALSALLRDRGKIAERVRGTVDWSLAWRERESATAPRLRFEADLGEVRSELPPPFAKSEAGAFDKLTIRSAAPARPDELVLTVDGGTALKGRLVFGRAGGLWRLQNGRIDVGRPARALPPQAGLALGVRLDALDIDQWTSLLEDDARATGAPALETVTAVSAEIGRLGLLNRDWGRAFLHFVRSGSEWRSVIDGDAAAGEGTFTLGGGSKATRARLDLTYLRLPQRRAAQEEAGRPPADPRRLPTVELHARSFEYQRRVLGELAFTAVSQPRGWHIKRLRLTRPEATLAVDGHWQRIGERETSRFNVELNSDDMGATLSAWGAEGQMARGKVRVQGDLAWPGAPTRPILAGLDGNVEVAAEKGRFLRFDPGAARLFGLLDLRSITRYLTLDFSPALGKGYAFDAIHGTIAIARGNASTSDLIVKGPALNLGVNGRVGLAAKDFDLTLHASPRVSDTVTLTSWGLFGPQVAAAVLALQRIFRSQIQEGTRITYVVKGPWDNPTVTKLAKRQTEEGGAAPESR